MGTRPITEAVMQKMRLIQKGELDYPEHITAWRKMVDARKRDLESRWTEGLVAPIDADRESEIIASMMRHFDVLVGRWFHDEEHLTWEELATQQTWTAEDLIKYTVYSTEDFDDGPSLETFALYLENHGFTGILGKLLDAYLADAEPLLAEYVVLTEHDRRVLANPKAAFGTSHKEVLLHRGQRFIMERTPKDAPDYVKHVLAAHLERGLGERLSAIRHIDHAQCIRAFPEYQRMMVENDPEIKVPLLQAERRKAELLIEIRGQYR